MPILETIETLEKSISFVGVGGWMEVLTLRSPGQVNVWAWGGGSLIVPLLPTLGFEGQGSGGGDLGLTRTFKVYSSSNCIG